MSLDCMPESIQECGLRVQAIALSGNHPPIPLITHLLQEVAHCTGVAKPDRVALTAQAPAGNGAILHGHSVGRGGAIKGGGMEKSGTGRGCIAGLTPRPHHTTFLGLPLLTRLIFHTLLV